MNTTRTQLDVITNKLRLVQDIVFDQKGNAKAI